MVTSEELRDLKLFIKSIDAKLEVLRTAFIALASLHDEKSRQNLIVHFDQEIHKRFDEGLVTGNPESYFDELRRHSYSLKELLAEMKPIHMHSNSRKN